MLKHLFILCASLAALGFSTSDAMGRGVYTAPSLITGPSKGGRWILGKNYFLIHPSQSTDHPNKIVVTEVFSYGCPACNAFHLWMDRLVASLPSGVVVEYVPASWQANENWPMYQRAFLAAKQLHVADKTNDAMFDAVWKTGELATYDLSVGHPKPKAKWPKIGDVARFYAKYGVSRKRFVSVAQSSSVNLAMKHADARVAALQVESTPTIVVDGKYRVSPASVGTYRGTLDLVKWLVSKEESAMARNRRRVTF